MNCPWIIQSLIYPCLLMHVAVAIVVGIRLIGRQEEMHRWLLWRLLPLRQRAMRCGPVNPVLALLLRVSIDESLEMTLVGSYLRVTTDSSSHS
jgi:hypothetical protein